MYLNLFGGLKFGVEKESDMDNWWNKKNMSEKLEKKIRDLNLNPDQMVNSKLFVYANLEMVDPTIYVNPLTLNAFGVS